jgi:hypothetical protein
MRAEAKDPVYNDQNTDIKITVTVNGKTWVTVEAKQQGKIDKALIPFLIKGLVVDKLIDKNFGPIPEVTITGSSRTVVKE